MSENVRKSGQVGDSGKSDLLAALLASGVTVREAAAKVGLTERSVYRAKEREGFRVKVETIRSALTDSALGILCDSAAAASETLRELLKSETESIRLAAAREVISSCVRLRADVEFERRLSDLERKTSNAPK